VLWHVNLKLKIVLNHNYYSGLSGLVLDRPKYLFPEPYRNISRLTYYSMQFNSIEINSSFYKIPLPSTVKKWSDLVHDKFKFTFKLFKEVTHCQGLFFKEELIKKFFISINAVKDKQGCLLVQFPPGLAADHFIQLARLLHYIKESNSENWQVAVEFRNKSWYNERTYDLLKQYQYSLVFHDMPGSATPMIEYDNNIIYLRFHGPTGNYRDSYHDSFLLEYVSYINEWIIEGKMVYLYFNNTAGEAFNNLKTLNKFVQSQSAFKIS
jgi:uncharacterized protein YecE (DUF72 family)